MEAKPDKHLTRKQAAYVLPLDLIRDVKVAAADAGVYPAAFVERVLRKHLRRQNRKVKTAPAGN